MTENTTLYEGDSRINDNDRKTKYYTRVTRELMTMTENAIVYEGHSRINDNDRKHIIIRGSLEN